MKKILWFSNVAFTEDQIRVTGTWQIAMGQALVATGEVELYNVTNGNVKEYTRNEVNGIVQWILPNERISRKGLPSYKSQQYIQNIEKEIQPDLVHIWGTENYWGMLAVNGILKSTVLLEMQGILYAYAKVFYGGLNLNEIIACTGLKELIYPKRLLYFRQKDFVRRGQRELIIIKKMQHISVQSDWVRAHIESENLKAQIYSTGMLLRNEFYKTTHINWKNRVKPVIFTTLSGANTFKGLHVLFRSLAILKKKYPDIQLRIGSNLLEHKFFIKDGYLAWLLREVENLDVSDSIVWLGSLSADEIIKEMQNSSVFAVPSYVETYSLAAAEAMMVGVPLVTSYAGALSELAVHNESALYFPIGDYMSCAWQIERVIESKELALKLSNNARNVAMKRNNSSEVVNKQLAIYNSIII